MATLLYSGQALPISEEVDVEQLATVILDLYAKGAHSWLTLTSAGAKPQTLRLLVGSGIPVGIIQNES